MAKGKAIRANIDAAFDAYCMVGGDKAATLRALKKRGVEISRPTLYAWIEEYNFDERRIEVDAKRQADREVTQTAWARTVSGLLKVMDQYETYMASTDFINDKGKPDHMAAFAYSGLAAQVRMYLRKLDYIKEEEHIEDTDVKAKAADILRDVYGIG